MKPEKKTKAQRISELEQKLEEAKAQQIYRHHFASKALIWACCECGAVATHVRD